MTIRDMFTSFTDASYSAATSIVGAAGTYLAPNSIDTAPLGTYLTELSAADLQLSAGTNPFRDLGGGERMWVVVDWITPPTGGTSADVQLITSASVSLSSPTIMYDFGVQTIATLTGPTQYGSCVRQIGALPRSASWLEWLGLRVLTLGTMTTGAYAAWIGKDVDSNFLGAANGYAVK